MKPLITLFLLLLAVTVRAQNPHQQIAPEQWYIFSNTTFTTLQVQSASTNTFIPAQSPSRAIGLEIIQTNAGTGSSTGSNYTINIYPAGDNANQGSFPKYGTNFATNAIVTISNTVTSTNDTRWTNIQPTVWEPATSLLFVVSNSYSHSAGITLIMQPCK